MNSLLKSSVLAAMLSLTMATTAGATQPNNNTSTKTAENQNTIAQRMQRSRFDATRTMPFVDEMIMLHMQMVDSARNALQTEDPKIRKMAQDTIKSSNGEIDRLVDVRRQMFLENPDKG